MFQDLTGERFGKLLVLRKSTEVHVGKAGRVYPKWDCLCDCGVSAAFPSHYLRAGRRSCGCLSPGPTVMTPTQKLFQGYQKAASQKHHEWGLSLEEFSRLIHDSCHYCGVPPTNVCEHRGQSMVFNGVDRVKNDVGYFLENVVSCCWICNRAKLNMTYEQFLTYLERVVSFRYRTR
jgi:hypothetical protein